MSEARSNEGTERDRGGVFEGSEGGMVDTTDFTGAPNYCKTHSNTHSWFLCYLITQITFVCRALPQHDAEGFD